MASENNIADGSSSNHEGAVSPIRQSSVSSRGPDIAKVLVLYTGGTIGMVSQDGG